MLVLFGLSHAHAYHYGMAGCGLGSLVFADQPGKIQVVAATVNNIVSPQTSAISSGTSGCFDGKGDTAKIDYIKTNLATLKEDAARGDGETLNGLLTLMNCQSSTEVKADLKSNYDTIFGRENAQQVFEAIKSINTVQKSCGFVG